MNLNPSTFQLYPEDEALIEASSKGAPAAEMDRMINKRRFQMNNAQFAIQNIVRELVPDRDNRSVHSLGSVVSAYDDFVKQIVSDKNCGVPLGFNYQILTENEIKSHLDQNHHHNNNIIQN